MELRRDAVTKVVPVSDAAVGDSSTGPSASNDCRTRYATFAECPLCGGDMSPEHAHFRCGACGWRDSCCD